MHKHSSGWLELLKMSSMTRNWVQTFGNVFAPSKTVESGVEQAGSQYSGPT